MRGHAAPGAVRSAGLSGRWAVIIAGLASGVVFAAVLWLRPFSPALVTAWDDLGLVAAAVVGALGCAAGAVRAARAGHARAAWAWAMIAAGVAGWGCGEAFWSWYELVAHRHVPFPSLADAGFLTFPLLTGSGLLLWPARLTGHRVRITALLDGAAVGTALLLVSWTTTLGARWEAGAVSPLALVIAVAYPISDILLVSLVVLLLARAEVAQRAALLLITFWLLAFALADSAFVYGATTGSYVSGDMTDTGWFIGFLALGAAGIAPAPRADRDSREPLIASWPRLALPYAPTTLAFAVFFSRLLSGHLPDPEQTWCGLCIFLISSARQLLALADNHRLLQTVQAGQDQLRHQAFHDPLTGLPNRALFADRVQQALHLAARDGQPRAVLFIDLDDFKLVNDRLGHAAGDRLLIDVAARLRTCVRAVDTVARLGGDEFAILLSGGHDQAEEIASRIVRALHTDLDVAGHRLQITASVGISLYPPRPDPASIDQLLAAADHAMYQAKTDGKNRYVLAQISAPAPAA